jgi:hypothetical protein
LALYSLLAVLICFFFHFRPFHLRLDGGLYLDEMMKQQMRQQQCRESYHPIMEFQEYFLNAYPVATPKFSIAWITDLAHNHLGGLFHVDKYFADFFSETTFQTQVKKLI